MIEKRHKTFVISGSLVPVDNICDDIGAGCTMPRLKAKYPNVSDEDVLDAINFYADNTNIPQSPPEQILDLIDVGSNGEVVIEITKMHQIVYIKLLSVTSRHYPTETSFTQMVNHGLRISCLRILDAREAGEELNPVDQLVFEALNRNIPKVLKDIEKTRDDLDYEEYLHVKSLLNQ